MADLPDWEHVEIHENLPQMILCMRGADGSCGCTHDRGRFAVPGAVAVGTRSPINCIFQYTGHGPIVFRRNKQNSIHLAYPSFQLSDFGRRILLLILVKRRNATKLERFDSCVFRRKLGCSPQRRDCMIRAADCRRYRGYELVSSFAIPSLEEFQLLVTGHTLHVTAYQAVALMPVRLGPKAGHFL